MTTKKFWMDEEEGCFNCGELEYDESITPGLCIQCNPTDPRHYEYED